MVPMSSLEGPRKEVPPTNLTTENVSTQTDTESFVSEMSSDGESDDADFIPSQESTTTAGE